MKVESEALKAAFDLIDTVPLNPVLPTSQFVKMEAAKSILRLRLAGIACAEAKTTCEGEISFHVDRRALGTFLTRATGTIICESGKGGMLLRTSGNRLTVAEVAEPGSYPDLKPSSKMEKLELDGPALSMLSSYCKTVTDSHLEVVCLRNKFGSFATDSLSVASILEPSINGEDVLVPRFIAAMIEKMKGSELLVDTKGAMLQSKLGRVYQPLPASDKPYPIEQTKNVLEAAKKELAIFGFKAEDMLGALKHLSGFLWAVQGTAVIYCHPDATAKRARLKLDAQAINAECSVAARFFKGKAPEKLALESTRLFPWLEYVKGFGSEVLLGTSGSLLWLKCKEEKAEHLLVLAGME